MIPYWVLFAICSILALTRVDFQEISRRNQAGLGLLMFLIALMIGFRFDVGGDYYNYIRVHNDLGNYGFWDVWKRIDPGYGLIDWIAGRFGLGTWVVNLICAAIFCWGLAKFLKSHPNPYLGLAVAVPYLIIVVGMGYTRQAAALGFLLAGMANFDRSRIVYFSVMCLLAVTFHKSAIVMLPVGLLALNHNRLVTFGLLLLLGAGLYYVFVQSSMDRLVQNYVTAVQSSQGAMMRVMMCVPPAMLLLAAGRRFRFTPDQARLYRNFAIAALVALAALLIGLPSTAVDRLALYILPIQMVVMARLVALFPQDQQSAFMLAVGIVGLYGLVLYVWLNYAINAQAWIPYQMLWFS